MKSYKQDFPGLISNPDVIYFDSAETTQKPTQVIRAVDEQLRRLSTNVHRATYTKAAEMTKNVEGVRKKIAVLMRADAEEIVFTAGSTDAINIIAIKWALPTLKEYTEILVPEDSHRSILRAWQELSSALHGTGKELKLVFYKNNNFGEADIEDIAKKTNTHTKLILITHIHNIYGVRTGKDILQLRKKIGTNVPIGLDATQSTGHLDVHVDELEVDFIFFSGHKMLALEGTGALWIHKRLHPQFSTRNMYDALEIGTPNITGIISLGAAIDYINFIGVHEIKNHIEQLTVYFIERIRKLNNIILLPGVWMFPCAIGYGIVSFQVEGISSQDVGFILDQNNICVRTGKHCNSSQSIEDSIRVSFHIYNSKEEIDRFIDVLQTEIIA